MNRFKKIKRQAFIKNTIAFMLVITMVMSLVNINTSKVKAAEDQYQEIITVGDSGCDYSTINEALDAVRKMTRSNEQKVTIMIQPGNYEEMLVIDTPNIELKNASDTPSTDLTNKGVDIDENAVRITWYYGHGYTYYSMDSNNKYNAEVLATNKRNGYASYINPGAGSKTYWNASVVISANNVSADGIIFENSFNQYVSAKSVEDVIVAQDGAKEGSVPRAYMKTVGDTKVQEKDYVERAAALAIYSKVQKVYFNNCKFVGRQDTLYGGKRSLVAFNNCSIYGGTDYIFGGMTAVFKECDLVFNTNDRTDKGRIHDVGYITAPQQASGRGFLMYNCHVTSTTPGVDTTSERTSKPGYFGRPWQGDTSEAVFFNTRIDKTDSYWNSSYINEKSDSLIVAPGWKSGLSDGSPWCVEYNTIEDANVDHSFRRDTTVSGGVLSEPVLADGTEISIKSFLGDWDPFTEKMQVTGSASVGGWFETIFVEWTDSDAKSAKVFYKKSEESDYVELYDTELIRQINNETGRVDIVGLSAGEYDIRVETTGGEVYTQNNIKVLSYDRSGYAHFKYNLGVGAYNDDGTLKDNAIVLYVTDNNKNSVQIPGYESYATGIGNILNGNGNSEPLFSQLASDNRPLAIRFIGNVGAPEGLTGYNSTENGGTEGDNGNMAIVRNAKNITLEGIGTDATIDGWGVSFFVKEGYENKESYEVRNLTFTKAPEDELGFQGAMSGDSLTAPIERVWVHHNSFYPGYCANPAESDKAEGDGSCDFKRGQYLTLAYNYYEGCHKTNLFGASDSNLQFHITMHHNYYKDCASRMPLVRQSNVHIYNNYFVGSTSKTVDARANAFVFSEANYYEACKNPILTKSDAVVKSFNDVFDNCKNDNNANITDNRNSSLNSGSTYANFDTNSDVFYYDSSNNVSEVYYMTDAAAAKEDCIALSGVMKPGATIDMNGTYNPGTNKNETNDSEQPKNDTIDKSQQDINNIINTTSESSFAKFKFKAKGKNKAIKLSWKNVSGAEGYTIYGSKSGKKMKKIKDMPYGVKSYTAKKLAKGTYYKFVIVAYRYSKGEKHTIATSAEVHCTTKGGKYGNPQKLIYNKKKVNVKLGKKLKLKLKYKSDKKVKKYTPKFRYESSNASIAKVDKKGKIRGMKKGKCYVYMYTQNGLYKRVRVSVK